MEICVGTQAICVRRFFTTPFFVIGPASLCPEAVNDFYRKCVKCVAPFVKGHINRVSVVLALVRLGGGGS